MKKIIFLLLILFPIFFTTSYVKAQNEDFDNLYQEFLRFYNSGDLVNAEKCLLVVLKSPETITDEYKVFFYNNLGATCTLLGKYKNALDYYNKAEILISNKQLTSRSLADIYINKAIIYGIQKSYSSATEYFEKGIRIFLSITNSEEKVHSSLASAYLDLGIVFLETKNYESALKNSQKSADLKLKYKLPAYRWFI